MVALPSTRRYTRAGVGVSLQTVDRIVVGTFQARYAAKLGWRHSYSHGCQREIFHSGAAGCSTGDGVDSSAKLRNPNPSCLMFLIIRLRAFDACVGRVLVSVPAAKQRDLPSRRMCLVASQGDSSYVPAGAR